MRRLASRSARAVCSVAARGALTQQLRNSSRWAHVPMGPKDPILGVTEAFKEDTSDKKLNLGVGAYRDDNNKPVVIDSVRTASKRIVEQNMNNEYLPIAGAPEFIQPALKLAYGADSAPLKEGRIAAVQALSGTGALRLAGEFVARFVYPASPTTNVYVPDPTWGNHISIFEFSGLRVHKYKYYDPATKGLHLSGLLNDIKNAPNNSFFVFHACAHNPTGVDPKPEQWKEISHLVKQKGHFVLIDMAYQGFASGDAEVDATALRQFVKDGHQVGLAQSFSKNFGLYGQRVGCFSLICGSADEAKRVESQLKIIARPMYSNPPMHGARVVSLILNDPALTTQWRHDVKVMAERIIKMRTLLKAELKRLGSTHNWDHITDQIGMFCYSGLTGEQVDRLTKDFHIYLTRNGRISMAGVTTKDVPYLAHAIHTVTK